MKTGALIDRGIGFGQRKRGNLYIELLGGLINHLVGAMHGAEWCGEWAAGSVFKTLARRQGWLLPDHAGALNFFDFAHSVGDHPMAAHELHRFPALIGNRYRIQKKPLAIARAGTRRVVLRLDAHADVSGCCFG